MLQELITSRARSKILHLFLANPDNRYHVREIVRRLDENYNSIRRELNKLESIGILRSSREANLRYYFMNKKLSIYEELQRIFYKTAGLGDAIRDKIGDIGDVKAAFIYGSLAKGEDTLLSDIDLFIVGEVDEDKLIIVIRDLEERLSREINYVLFSSNELKSRYENNDPFITNVLSDNKIMLIGDNSGII
jgi:predicted nucleotidyltransferase